MDTRNDNRTLPPQTPSGRPPEDDRVIEALEEIVEEHRRLIEQNRLLIEENRLLAERCERLLEKCDLIEERGDALRRGLIENLREFYSMLLETLSAAIGARNLAWNYVAYTVLKGSGFTEEEIRRRYEDEKKAWIEEREEIAQALEEAVRNLDYPFGPEAFASSGAVVEEPDFGFGDGGVSPPPLRKERSL